MSPKKNKKPPAPTSAILATDFPALCDFMRAYLHEDWPAVSGSPAGAARQFAEDADAAQLHQVAQEWKRFRERTRNWPLDAINKALYEVLGANWYITDAAQFDAVSEVFRT